MDHLSRRILQKTQTGNFLLQSSSTKISADASSHGLGAILLQQQNNTWHPVAFASTSISQTECRYAQIEKEVLALTRALERFSEYILGKVVHLETDHKSLIPLLGQKCLPPHALRFRPLTNEVYPHKRQNNLCSLSQRVYQLVQNTYNHMWNHKQETSSVQNWLNSVHQGGQIETN